MIKTRNTRSSEGVNAGSMADIAFLLLIFFLVTTVILEDKGILVKLPPYDPDERTLEVVDNNVLAVKINLDDELMIEKKRRSLEDIRPVAKEFILNPDQRSDLPSSPKNAVISLQHDRGTNYKMYLEVYNELKATYREIWDERAHKLYGKTYNELNKVEQNQIRAQIPLVISEAEPTEF